jgi:predicted RNA-binding protein (TIGR00451 family)
MKRHYIRKKEYKKLCERLPLPVQSILTRSGLDKFGAEEVALKDLKVYLIKGRLLLIENKEGHVFPSLNFYDALMALPKVVVDMGAVPHVGMGADVMRPGVVFVEEEFPERTLVTIIDEKGRKPIAVGMSLHSSKDMRELRSGRVVTLLHYLGDEVRRIQGSI